MKITITGFTNDPEVFTYSVQQVVRGTVSGTASMTPPVEKTISAVQLVGLSAKLPDSKPGDLTDEEILLAGIHDMHYKDDGADLVGKSGRMGMRKAPNHTAHAVEIPTAADLDYIEGQARVTPPALTPRIDAGTPVLSVVVGNRTYTIYESLTGWYVYLNEAMGSAYIGDSLSDAKRWVKKDASDHLFFLLR